VIIAVISARFGILQSWQLRHVRFREEFRTPLGVRKSPKNEPAVSSRVFMGIAEIRRTDWGGRDDFGAVQDRCPRRFGS
jgi:hypothetical protein